MTDLNAERAWMERRKKEAVVVTRNLSIETSPRAIFTDCIHAATEVELDLLGMDRTTEVYKIGMGWLMLYALAAEEQRRRLAIYQHDAEAMEVVGGAA